MWNLITNYFNGSRKNLWKFFKIHFAWYFSVMEPLQRRWMYTKFIELFNISLGVTKKKHIPTKSIAPIFVCYAFLSAWYIHNKYSEFKIRRANFMESIFVLALHIPCGGWIICDIFNVSWFSHGSFLLSQTNGH